MMGWPPLEAPSAHENASYEVVVSCSFRVMLRGASGSYEIAITAPLPTSEYKESPTMFVAATLAYTESFKKKGSPSKTEIGISQ